MRALMSPRGHARQLVRVSVIALLVGLFHVVTVSPASATAPEGVLDFVTTPEPGRVGVRGWAFDRDQPGVSVNIHVYVGTPGADYGVDTGPANTYRPDVGQVYGLGDYHGFDTAINVPLTGDQEVRVYAIDADGLSNTLIGTGLVTIADASPSGAVESSSSPAHRTISLAGWASDPSSPTTPVAIEAYVGGSFNTPGVEFHALTANSSRADGKLGFSSQFVTAKTGAQDVYVYAKNVPGTPGGDRLIGVSKVTVFVDDKPPQTTITSAPKVATPSDAISVSFAADEVGSTFECRWDTAPWARCATGSTTSLTPGEHLVEVRATDPAGNTDPTPASALVVVSNYVTQPPLPGTERAIRARAVKKKSRLRIDVDPDATSTDHRVVIQRKVGKRWRKVDRLRTRGEKHVVVVNLRRGKYRVVLPKSPEGPALRSSTVRLRR